MDLFIDYYQCKCGQKYSTDQMSEFGLAVTCVVCERWLYHCVPIKKECKTIEKWKKD